MMSGGLSNQQRQELRFIRHLVSEVDAFNSDKFKEMVQQYEKSDADIFKILKTSRDLAQSQYDKYLDEKVLRIGGLSSIGFEKVIQGEGTVLDLVATKLRGEAYKDKEFRGYLSQSMLEITKEYDLELRKAYRVAERQRQMEKPSLGKKILSFGLNR
ncbi:MAG: hypothetical protein K2Q26_12565 [Bdellovibrionales bacterium]|nr:hypothetical protein [Bdellovibrionales bacterium]